MNISRKDEKGINKDHRKTVRKMTVRVETDNKEQLITKVIKKEIKDVSN